MANVNGNNYRDQRGVDVGDEQRRRGAAVGVSGTNSAAVNSSSLDELFVSGVGGGRQDGNHYSHQSRSTAASTQDIIRLDHPRPSGVRARNEYVDVTKNAATLQIEPSVGQMDGLRQSHRAHSAPLSASATTSVAPSTRSDQCPYCVGRPGGTRVNFDRLTIAEPSKSTTALTNVCQRPSTSKPTTPGQAIRVFNSNATRNGGVALPVISSQPKSLSNNSDKRPASANGEHFPGDRRRPSSAALAAQNCSSSSFICKNCGRCRCSACTTPRTFPSRWICDNSCLLSKESIVETASCMCCVKGCWYHAGSNFDDVLDERYRIESSDGSSKSTGPSDDSSYGSRPSLWSCSPFGTANCFFRWTVLASAMLCLPCVWCYLPFKLCAAGCERAYSRYHDNSCRCDAESRVEKKKKRSSRSATRGYGRDATRRLRRKRSHTLPPELPSIAAAKAAAGCNGLAETSIRSCGSSNYS